MDQLWGTRVLERLTTTGGCPLDPAAPLGPRFHTVVGAQVSAGTVFRGVTVF